VFAAAAGLADNEEVMGVQSRPIPVTSAAVLSLTVMVCIAAPAARPATGSSASPQARAQDERQALAELIARFAQREERQSRDGAPTGAVFPRPAARWPWLVPRRPSVEAWTESPRCRAPALPLALLNLPPPAFPSPARS
jgi:hypothetical protein